MKGSGVISTGQAYSLLGVNMTPSQSEYCTISLTHRRRHPSIIPCGDYFKVPLTRGLCALVSAEDAERVGKLIWRAFTTRGRVYAVATIPGDPKRSTQSMQAFVMQPAPGFTVDHVNRDHTLDNRRNNLRVATISQNAMNRGTQTNNTSGFKGVFFHRPSGKYHAGIMVKGKRKYLGSFTSSKDAADAYDRAAKSLHGDYAVVNDVRELQAQLQQKEGERGK